MQKVKIRKIDDNMCQIEIYRDIELLQVEKVDNLTAETSENFLSHVLFLAAFMCNVHINDIEVY